MSENKIIKYIDTIPEVDDSVFFAAGVKIIGNVKIGKNSSIWYNTVVRGDVNYITIGEKTNIQDLSMLHVTAEEFPLILGDEITIGHSVTLHGCVLKDRTFIGMGATILDGAVVRQGFTVPSGKLVAGVPAKIIRDLTESEIENIKESAERYKKYAQLSSK